MLYLRAKTAASDGQLKIFKEQYKNRMYRENPFRNFSRTVEEHCAQLLWWYICIYTSLGPSPAWNNKLTKVEKCSSVLLFIFLPQNASSFLDLKTNKPNQTKNCFPTVQGSNKVSKVLVVLSKRTEKFFFLFHLNVPWQRSC